MVNIQLLMDINGKHQVQREMAQRIGETLDEQQKSYQFGSQNVKRFS